MNIGSIISQRRTELDLTLEELGNKVGVTKSTVKKWESGYIENMKRDKIALLAKALHLNPSTFITGDVVLEKPSRAHLNNNINLYELSNNNIYNVPIYDSVSAGFGTLACNHIVGYTPLYFKNSSDVQNTLCINVKGDSMYPKIEDGDTIQVRRQTSVDSGSIAVVLLDGDEGLVKKVVYGNDFVELHSINPMYQTMRFEGAEVQRLEVVGLVKTIIKHL